MNDSSWLTPEVIAAVLSHMNNDHVEDNVVICRGVGGADGVTAAICSDLDLTAVFFEADSSSGTRIVRIAFEEQLTDRPQIRAEIARMYHESAALLGLPPRA